MINSKDIAIIIPARLGSTRLPNKPLLEIDGLPMIVRTAKNCIDAKTGLRVIVATDSDEVADTCKDHAVEALKTKNLHLTGTDRVAEVCERLKLQLVINLQGDEPVFPKQDLKTFVDYAIKKPNSVTAAFCKVRDEKEFSSTSIPKVVFDERHRLLYASRAGIPYGKGGVFEFAYRQVCIYGFPGPAISKFYAERQKTKFEKIEDIEMLRFLEIGIPIELVELSNGSTAIDTAEDLEKVRKRFA